MKADTSPKRVVAITVLCLLLFPVVQQTYNHYVAVYQNQTRMAALEVFGEIAMIKRLLAAYVINTEQWPESFQQLNVANNQFSLDFDLSQPELLQATVKKDFYAEDLQNESIGYAFDLGTKRFTCLPDSSQLARSLLPADCGGTLYGQKTFNLRDWALVVAVGALFVVVVLAVFNHALLKLLRKNQYQLNQHPSHQLKKLDRLLGITGQRQALLTANAISKKHWQKMTGLDTERPVELIQLLQQSLPIQTIQTVEKKLYRLGLAVEFPLSVSELMVLVPAQQGVTQTINKARAAAHDATTLLLLELRADHNRQLRRRHGQLPAQTLVPDLTQITQLLLPELAQSRLITLLVRHLPATQLSPYQGKGGVVKPSHFYGRQAILSKLQSQRERNFFLVGGRQLGKTSILKALHRELSKNPHNHCIYLSLSDAQLLPRLSFHTQIEHHNDLVALLTQLAVQQPNKNIRILVDEADRFVATEAQQQYPLLKQIKQCADQGLCQFVFVGFWELFAHAVLDYHSPLKNFAETITVGALETHAAKQLIAQPMQLLQQKIDHDATIDQIIKQTGGRANLINLVCENVLTHVGEQPQVIDAELVNHALQSQAVTDAMQGWSNLTHNRLAAGLDRILVYLTFVYQSLDMQTINSHLEQHQLQPEPEAIKQSLQRLVLAHVLVKKATVYVFAVPIFAQQFSTSEAQILLQQETKGQLDTLSGH